MRGLFFSSVFLHVCVCIVTYLIGLLWPGGDARPIREIAEALSPLGGKRGVFFSTEPREGNRCVRV